MIDKLVRAIEEENVDEARVIFYDFAKDAPKVFKSFDQPWEYKQDDAAIKSTFLVPLAMAYCGTDNIEEMKEGEETVSTLIKLNEQAGTSPGQGRAGKMCGHVFKEGEPTFSCKECATDPTCVLCQECFSQSAHKQHKYRMYTSNGSGYCDCGDPDAWTAHYACTVHSPDNAINVPVALPEHLAPRIRCITTVILEYAVRVLSWKKEESFLLAIPELRQITDPKRTYQTILFNDETHTYDSVIRALELSIHCTKEQAMMLATFVDKEGCTSVATGDKDACVRVLTDIKRRTQRDRSQRTERQGPLVVHVLESELISHQHLAISLLQWLSEQLSVFPLITDMVGEILLKERVVEERMEVEERSEGSTTAEAGSPSSSRAMEMSPEKEREGMEERWVREEWRERQTMVDAVMAADAAMWKQARASWHQLLMRTVLMNMEQKLAFSRRFLALYDHLQRGFIEDDQEHDASIVALSVQMLTVPPIARRLIAEENAIYRILSIFLTHCEQWVTLETEIQGVVHVHRRRFDFSKHSYPVALKRALHMTRDCVYLLTQKPSAEEWNDDLRYRFIMGFRELIKILDLIQGMDEVKRQEGEHQQYEMEWETAFNIQLRLQELVTLMLAWANEDPVVHLEVTELVTSAMLKFLREYGPIPEPGNTHTHVTVGGVSHVVPVFDVLRQPVSIHMPVFRLLAGLVTTPLEAARRYLDPSGLPETEKEEEVKDALKALGENLFEMQTRVLVLCAQTAAHLWRRNGFSLVNQVHNYFSPLCRTEMFDQDVVALQYAAATAADASKFIIHLLSRYKIATWALPEFELVQESRIGMERDEISKHTVILAENFFSVILHILGERYRPGVGQCTRAEMLEREIIHILAMGPQTFSFITQKLHNDPLTQKISQNEAVAKVADFKRLTANAAGKFELKDEYLNKYDTFFYHYTRPAASAAEQYQKKLRANKERSLRACPPPVPLPLCPLFRPLTRILLAPALLATLSINLERVGRRSRFQSEAIFQRVLHIIGIGLHEQARDLIDFDFVGVASGEKFRLLALMEELSNKPESAAHADLLWWTIQKFKEVTASRDTEIFRRAGGEKAVDEREETGRGEKRKQDGTDDEEEQKRKREAKAALAAKMRANAMNQMQRLQKKFTAQVEKEEEEGKEKEGDSPLAAVEASEEDMLVYDEDDDCPVMTNISSFPVCIGPGKVKVDKVHARSVTCVLCQEKEVLEPAHARFVCAAYVQRSQLFTQHVPSSELRLDSFLVNACLVDEMETTTCSHTMHYECYQNLMETHQMKERRGRQLLANHVLDHENGEYLCPLCKRLSNTAVPLLPAMQAIEIMGFSTNRPAPEHETFDEWVTEMKRFVALTKPKHSRKRSHSERSLLDLGKNRGDRATDPLAQGSLESALSNSVPSASQMDLFIAPREAAAREVAEREAAAAAAEREQIADRNREARIMEEGPAAVMAELEALLNRIPRERWGPVLDDMNDAMNEDDEEEEANPPERDDELLLLLRGAAGVVAEELQEAERDVAMLQQAEEFEAAAAAVGAIPPLQPLDPAAPAAPAAAAPMHPIMQRMAAIIERAVQAGEQAEQDAAAGDVNAAEEIANAAAEVVAAAAGAEPPDAQLAAAVAVAAAVERPRQRVIRGRGEGRREIEAAAEAVQRRMQAIPGVLTGIIKSLPATILQKLSKRVLPLALADSEEGVRHFTKFLMKTHITTEETRSFSSAITVWRSTIHVLRSISAVLEIEGKPLFGALNTRQRECITCVTRLSALLSCNLAPFGELIKVMMRMLLHPAVSNTSSSTFSTTPSAASSRPHLRREGGVGSSTSMGHDAPLSPPPVYNCRPAPPPAKEEKRGGAAAAAWAFLFQSEKKETTFSILNIDILALTMELMMCIGWTWHDGARTAKNLSTPTKEMVADGSSDELHVMRLGLTAFLFQVMATHDDPLDTEMGEEGVERGEEEEEMERRVEGLWREVRGEECRNVRGLVKSLRSAIISFLRPLALLYQALSLVPPPEALRDPSVDEFEPLCRYMGLPPSMAALLSTPVLEELFVMWAPCVPCDVKDIPKQPAPARQLIPLPRDFSDLVSSAAKFRCPSIPLDEKSTMPTMCLLCGKLLCSQSYCCQKFQVNKDNVGACMQHISTCSGGTGMFLRIRDCYIVLLTNRMRGCIRPAPYVDEFGEVDQGFRRGNPMHINDAMYAKLKHLWLHQNISEEVVNRYELDHRNMQYDWNHF